MIDQDSPSLPDAMFLVDVKDPMTGETFQTLSISRTPPMLLSFAANKFTEAASNFFNQRYGVGTVDWRMILLLARKPGITSVQAAHTIGVDKGTVSRSVSRLDKSNLIILGELHANGRSRGLSLSSAGRSLHDRILTDAMRQQAYLLKGMEAAEVQTFCDLLLRFTDNVEKLIEQDQQNSPPRSS